MVSKQLGEGAMGRVYLAADPELGRQVAIKVLRLDTAGNARDAYIARFRNEARAAARLQHPNVVTVHDAGVDATLGPYLVYEFVAGQTLRGRINDGKLDPKATIALARGVAAALDAMHAAGIIHRDIKPDNILISPDGAVKVTDFGIARLPDAHLTRDGQFLGTPAYAAPEAITRGVYTAKGDQFSLAAVLYESMCGIRPFPGDDAVAVSYAVANDRQPPPSKWVKDLPPLVDQCFERALSKKANDRFHSAGEFAATLSAAFRGSAQVSALASAPLARRAQHAGANPIQPAAPAPVVAPIAPMTPQWKAFAIVGSVVAVAFAIAVVRWANSKTPAQDAEGAGHTATTTPSTASTRATAPAVSPRTRTRQAAPTAVRSPR
jgi:serine/threonine-protein kinase